MPARITYKKAVDHIANLPGFSMESPEEDYENADSRIIIRHHDGDINHTFETTYRLFWNRKRCFKCGDLNRGKHRAQNKAKEYIQAISPDYTILEEYVKTSVPILTRHNVCGYEWKVSPNSLWGTFKQGKTMCPQCNDKVRMTPEIFYRKLAENNTNEFKSVKFVDTNHKVEVVCPQNHYTLANYHSMLYNNYRCSICSYSHAGEYHKYSKKDIQNKLDNKFGKNEIKIVGDYINYSTPTKFMHNSSDCNYYTWDAQPILVAGDNGGKGCPKCLGNIKNINTDDFKKRVYELVGNEYIVLGEYKGSGVPIKMQHNIKECHHVFSPMPNNFTKTNGTRCPIHGDSHGEYWVGVYLKGKGYVYEEEKKYPDLRDKNYLRYDFYLNDYDILIEYDGEQHTKRDIGGRFGDNFDYDTLHKHDLMKNEYSKKNNIPLIRIPYTVVGQEAVNNYLDEKLAEFIK